MKLSHFLSCLDGEARNLVESFELREENYEVVWGVLTKKYESSEQALNAQLANVKRAERV